MLGHFERAVLVYREMVEKFIYPDEETFYFVLRSFCCLGDVEKGKRVHGCLVKLGLDSCRLVGSALEDFYRKSGGNTSGGLDYWNFFIVKAAQSGNGVESFRLFKTMRLESVELNSVTLISLLRSSVDLNLLSVGKIVHCLVLVSNLGKDLAVNTILLSMYAKLGALRDAGVLFEKMPERDCVVWNVMISANSRNRRPKDALRMLSCMGRSGIRADLFTALPAISSIAQLKAIEWGKQMHVHVLRNGIDYQVSVHNSLIDMYCECDKLGLARMIFDLVNDKTLVTWSAMIKGYVTHDQFLDALSLFTKMKSDGLKADFITIINILPACVNIGALENVKCLHGYSIKFGLGSLSSLNTVLLVSYSKCGCIEMARKLFDEEKINDKDVITWNSMISAYARHGDWKQCFDLYGQMKQSNIIPDQITFLGVLTACVNSGLVEEGKKVFKEMTESYGCQPNQEHYACMVDLLGRAGHINEARELVKSMPFEPDARVWGSLLSTFKMANSETGLAEYAAEKLITMEPKNAGNYILLSNIYAAAGKWDGVAKMRSVLRDRGLKKTPGCSWLEINGRVHEFRVADWSHPRSNDIYTILGNLEMEIKMLKDKTLENMI